MARCKIIGLSVGIFYDFYVSGALEHRVKSYILLPVYGSFAVLSAVMLILHKTFAMVFNSFGIFGRRLRKSVCF